MPDGEYHIQYESTDQNLYYRIIQIGNKVCYEAFVLVTRELVRAVTSSQLVCICGSDTFDRRSKNRLRRLSDTIIPSSCTQSYIIDKITTFAVSFPYNIFRKGLK